MSRDTEVVFMDEPDEASVGVWKSSLSDEWGIYLEFTKKGRNPDKLMIRISMANPADLIELAHLMENTARGSREARDEVDQEGLPRP